MWDWVAWIAVALAVWVTVAVLVGLLLGRVVRQRDRQVPHDGAGPPRSGPPRSGPPAPDPSVTERHRPG